MTTEHPEPVDSLERFGAAYLRLRQLLADAREAQWQMGKTPTPKEDTTERSKGLYRDPVPTTVLDARRVALRAAVVAAERAVRGGESVMRHAIAHLERVRAQGAQGD